MANTRVRVASIWRPVGAVLSPAPPPPPTPPPPGDVQHGAQVDATNTGVVGAGFSYSALAATGDDILKASWFSANQDGNRVWFGGCPEKPTSHWHFERFDVSGRINVSINDLHVRWCRVRGAGTYPLRFVGTTTFDSAWGGLIAEYVEFDGSPGSVQGAVLLHSSYAGTTATVRRCHIHNYGWGFRGRRNNIITGNLVEGIHYSPGSHNTCLALQDGSASWNVDIVGNKFLGGNSSALSLYTDNGPVQDVLVQDNYVAPDVANYGVYGGEDTTTPHYVENRDIRFIGNVFGRDKLRFCGSSAPYTDWNPNRPGNVWSDNQWGPRGPFWLPGDPEEGDPVV